ncbi:MAG: sodium:calcium antiporter [Ilumatobacteraceae bacterium]
MTNVVWLMVMVGGAGAIVWGAEVFAEHLADASKRLGVTAFALALLLAGAEPEELATVITASARDVGGVAFGDVIGANATIVTVALGVGAWMTLVPFGRDVRRYAFGGLLTGVIASMFAWDGRVGRLEGVVLVASYVAFVAAIWWRERRPPTLGEAGELDEAVDPDGRVGSDLAYVVAGLVALSLGSIALVEAVRRISGIEETQTRLGLTVVAFATAFELVVLAYSASRHGITEAVVAGVIGSYAYNMTMSLGLGAVIVPLSIDNAGLVHWPLVVMLALMAVAIGLATRNGTLGRRDAVVLFAGYPVFVIAALLGG